MVKAMDPQGAAFSRTKESRVRRHQHGNTSTALQAKDIIPTLTGTTSRRRCVSNVWIRGGGTWGDKGTRLGVNAARGRARIGLSRRRKKGAPPAEGVGMRIYMAQRRTRSARSRCQESRVTMGTNTKTRWGTRGSTSTSREIHAHDFPAISQQVTSHKAQVTEH